MTFKMPDRMKIKPVTYIIALLASVAVLLTVPVSLCGVGWSKWMAGDVEDQLKLSRGVARLVLDESLTRSNYRTGSGQYDGEWLFGTYLMAGIGFSQMAIEHPDLRESHGALAKRCIEQLLTPEVRAFDREMWGEDPLEALDGENDHAAYLGYLNVLLGLYRIASGDDAYNDLNDRITAFLVRQLSSSPIGLLQSYDGEVYPVDNCFVIGSLGLHQRAAGQDHGDTIDRWVNTVRERYMDPDTRLLVQAVDPWTGSACDDPRGSGTALGIVVLHYADRELAQDLYAGLKSSLAKTWLGFGAVREYPEGIRGQGDIDSGPVIFGYGFSATGFSVAGARIFGDESYFRRLYATARMCGAPVNRSGYREYVSGGSLGNAILFAMLTAPRGESGQ